MIGNVPRPQIMEFSEINIGKFKTTKHFELVHHTADEPDTDKINVVRDRHFAQSLPDFWMSYRLKNRWRRITGLFKVGNSEYYKGDKGRNNVKENLIIVSFDETERTATVYTFKGYYSTDPAPAIQLIKSIKA